MPEPVRRQPLQRVPPHDDATEANLLGAALLDRAAAQLVAGLNPEIFYRPSHGFVAQAVAQLVGGGNPTDAGTVGAHLRQQGLLDAAGGNVYLLKILAECPATSSAPHWAELVAEHADKRRILGLAGEVVESVYSGIPVAGLVAEMHRAAVDYELGQESSWTPVNLAAVLAGEGDLTEPGAMWRTDGVALLYPGKINTIQAEPEAGKSWILQAACAAHIQAHNHVMYVDFEGDAPDVTERILALGCQPDEILAYFHYIRPDDPIDATAQAHIAAACEAWQPVLAVIDGVTEAMALSGWSIKENDDVARFLASLPRLIASRGAAVALIDHVVKDKERQDRFAIGGQHKLAGSDGVTYKLEAMTPFSVGHAGTSRLIIVKDRHGKIRPHAVNQRVAAVVHFRPGDRSMTVAIEPPPAGSTGEPFRPTGIMDRISYVLEHGPALTSRQLRASVHGKSDLVDLAVRLLVAEGFVQTATSGRAVYHSNVRRFHKDPIPDGTPPDSEIRETS